MHNACTWINCDDLRNESTEAMTDGGRAWAHLCPKHKAAYDARMRVAEDAMDRVLSMHRVIVEAAGGEEAWRRFVIGPFGKRVKPPVSEDEALSPL